MNGKIKGIIIGFIVFAILLTFGIVFANFQPSTKRQTFLYDDLEITFNLPVNFVNHRGNYLIQIPITVTNIGNVSNGLHLFRVKIFNPQGREIPHPWLFNADFDNVLNGYIRQGVTINSYLWTYFEGDGIYIVEFADRLFRTYIEIELNISK